MKKTHSEILEQNYYESLEIYRQITSPETNREFGELCSWLTQNFDQAELLFADIRVAQSFKMNIHAAISILNQVCRSATDYRCGGFYEFEYFGPMIMICHDESLIESNKMPQTLIELRQTVNKPCYMPKNAGTVRSKIENFATFKSMFLSFHEEKAAAVRASSRGAKLSRTYRDLTDSRTLH